MTFFKHADLIRAVLDGKTVQHRIVNFGPSGPWDIWKTVDPEAAVLLMVKHPRGEYRIEPNPPVTKEQALAALIAYGYGSERASETLRRFIEEQP
jgi:hypothetical protein